MLTFPEGIPTQRSRSLSPANSLDLSSRRERETDQRIQDLEELLQFKIKESEELKNAHDRRRERLCLIQDNYKVVCEQVKEMKKSNDLSDGRIQRADPSHLRQEDSDAVWNELAYLKYQSRKLSTEKASLEEELDMLRVQAAMDRATVKELRLCLAKEHRELLHKVGKEHQVKSSTSKELSVSSERMEQSFKKIEQLEQRMFSLEGEKARLVEEKEQLLETVEDLTNNCCTLQASLDRSQAEEAVRKEAALSQAEGHCNQIAALEAQLSASQKEAAKLHQHLLKMRQELSIVGASRDFYKNRAAGPHTRVVACNGGGKVKLRSTSGRSRLGGVIGLQGRSPSPTKDKWEDMSADSADEHSDSLNSQPSGTATFGQRSNKKSYRFSHVPGMKAPVTGSNRKQADVLASGDEQREPWERGTRGAKGRCWRRRQMLMKAQRCSSSSLQQRVESLQRHIDILRGARKDAVLSARELQRANERITAQLNSLSEKLCSSKQLSQKLTSDLAGVEQQKKVLQMELEQWRRVTLPPQSAPLPSRPPAQANAESSGQGRAACAPESPAPLALEAQVKQLQTKLKSTSAEVTRQVAANKALRGQLQEKEDKLRLLQDKTSHAERDANMKRQLVEDLKTRLKFLQEMEKSYRGQVDELEKKVKALTEEATNWKALIESLKRRLHVATTEKSQCETSCTKLKEDLGKKEQRIHALQVRIGDGEQALSALEKRASEQMEGLTQQSSSALDRLQRQLGQAHSQLEQLHAFIKALASEILLDVQEVKQQLMRRRRRLKQAGAVAAKGGLSAKSMIKAKSIAASILNMSENDLADIMDTDQAPESLTEDVGDREWLDRVENMLQQKIPSAGQLMGALRVKMKERKVLTEELATIGTPVSEKA